jgi:hypothetical protein
MSATVSSIDDNLLAADDLPMKRFMELVGTMTVPDSDRPNIRIWAEAPDGWALDYFPTDLGSPICWYAAGHLPEKNATAAEVLHKAYSGRIFAPSGELKWRVVSGPAGSLWRCVFLGRADWIGNRLTRRDELADLRRATNRVLLWGQKSQASPDAWIELRIPHRFRYPVTVLPEMLSGPIGVQAEVELWTDSRGEPHFVRLVDLIAFRTEETA